MREMTLQGPITELVFPPINCRHKRQYQIVELHADSRGNFVTLKEPGHRDRKKGLQTPERGKTKEDPDRQSHRDRMRRVFDRYHLDVDR